MPAARRVAAGPRFSIIMPSFNQARFIERSLNSVLNQEYERTELIVMDGGSSDGSRDILEKYSRHIAVWRSEPDVGQSDALNKGFARATGDIYGWLNSDDLYLPGALHHAAQIFAVYPGIDVVYGDWLTIDEGDRITEHFPALAPSRARTITEGFFCNAQSMFWRRSLHRRLGELDIALHYTMDYDLILRMISVAGRRAFFRTDRPLGCFRVYPGQKTGSADPRIGAEHRRIAARAGTAWKYSPAGHAVRLAYRLSRGAQFLARGRAAYLLLKLKSRFGARPITGRNVLP
jgi:glycosyltransferase involved in cell wall biosynthesis